MMNIEEGFAAESHTSWGAFAEVAVEGNLTVHAEPDMGAVGQEKLCCLALGNAECIGFSLLLCGVLHLDDVVGQDGDAMGLGSSRSERHAACCYRHTTTLMGIVDSRHLPEDNGGS